MPEPAFSQPEHRSYLLPIGAAAAVLALAIALAIHFFPATTVNIAHVKTDVVPTSTVFGGAGSIVVGRGQAIDVLYVGETLRIDNQLRTPIFLDNFTLTLTTDAGEVVQTAISKDDLATVRTSFPALEPALQNPLLRETTIDPGKQAEGVVLFNLRISKAMWDARRSAVVKVDLYHQNPVYQTIPKS